LNLAAALEERATARGFLDRPAVLTEGSSLTHREVHDGARRTASLLASQGAGRGDTVLLALHDGPALCWAFLGAVGLGAIAVPVNPRLPADDHRALAGDCGPAVTVCADDLADRFGGTPVVTAGSLGPALAGFEPEPPVPAAASDPAYAQYTSGTTGAPRAAVHGHGDALVYAAAFADPALRLGPGDVVLSVSKMFFAYGLGNSLFFPLLSGASAVVHPGRPTPQDIADLVERHRVTVLFAVPTFYANLIRAEVPPTRLGSLRVAVTAGERLPSGLASRTAELLGCPLVDSLGSTEVGQAFVAGTPGELRPGTVGRALPPYEVAVRGDDGAGVLTGTIGMLWVRGPTLLREYLGGASAATFDGDWLRTGDLASIDEDGYLRHHGRADDMEMVGGITVAAQEIEDLLSAHPAVSEVAVAAVVDEMGASRLRAFVVPAPGVDADEQLGEDLTGLARARLAAYKVPRSVTFVGALPRTPTGKLRRFMLRSGEAWRAPVAAGEP